MISHNSKMFWYAVVKDEFLISYKVFQLLNKKLPIKHSEEYCTSRACTIRHKAQGTRDKGQGTRDKEGARYRGQGTRKAQGSRYKEQERHKAQGTRSKEGTRHKRQGTSPHTLNFDSLAP
jgi:hypothetical protein